VSDEPETLQGTLEHILFTSEDGYTVARLLCPESVELVTMVGHLPSLKLGEKLRLWGEWTTHPKYGLQFKIHAYEIVVPTTVELFESLDLEVALASPTGRAAKRMEEATNRPAQTLHRLLEYSPQTGFRRDEHDPLEADVVIVDEASMIDLFLMYALIRALRPEARLILVGDADQLPSVGPGRVLWDLIDPEKIPVIKLTEIFRQARESLIVQNAHRINRGRFPGLSSDPEEDFLFLEVEDPREAADLVEELVCSWLPERYGYEPVQDIQVLSPMYRGEAGVDHLNHVLQARLNPNPLQSLAFGGRRFHLDGKVMQIRW
jgi:exodeoxyribonuclease V alpha subunit